MKSFYLIALLIISQKLLSQDVIINPGLLWNGESSLAINPTNSQNLIVARMRLNLSLKVDIAVSYSNNGGASWSNPVLMPHFSTTFTSADPTLVFRNDGVCFLAYIDYKFNHDSGAVYITKTMDGGITWSTPSKAIDGFASADKPVDRPWLAIDNSSGSFSNRLYLITKSIKDAPLPHHIWLLHSDDDGQNWSQQKLVDDSISTGLVNNSMGVPTVTSTGKLNVLYIAYDLNVNLFPLFAIASSTDGGANLNYSVAHVLPANAALASTDTLVQVSYHIAANPVDSDNLVITFTDKRNGDVDILSCNTNDGGQSWSTAKRLNDDALGNGVYQDMSWAGFSNAGIFAALWRDRRTTGIGQTVPYKIYGSASFDGGNTFKQNFALSSDTGSLFIPVDGNDFLGCAVFDSTVYGTWTDRRNGSNQLYFNKKGSSVLLSTVQHENENSFFQIKNPAYDFVEIKTDLTDFEISIYDLNGRLLQTSKKKTIDVHAYSKGIYMVQMKTRQGLFYGKFVKE